jgi:uncharacterized protein
MSAENKQYIYVLKLLPEFLNADLWTDKEERIIDNHFAVLKMLLFEGKLILAGKTLGIDEKTFGIVILEVDSEEEANTIMSNDPAVVGGLMIAELYPYEVALMNSGIIYPTY